MSERPRRPATPAHALFGALFIVVAVGLGLAAFTIGRTEQSMRDGALRTTAHVVAAVGKGPVVRFVTQSGVHMDVTLAARWPRSYAIGTDVPIYYHPDNPAFAGLDDRWSHWYSTVAMSALCLASLLIGVVLTRASRGAARR